MQFFVDLFMIWYLLSPPTDNCSRFFHPLEQSEAIKVMEFSQSKSCSFKQGIPRDGGLVHNLVWILFDADTFDQRIRERPSGS